MLGQGWREVAGGVGYMGGRGTRGWRAQGMGNLKSANGYKVSVRSDKMFQM